MAQEFPYDLDRRYLPLLLPLGFRPGHDRVTIDDEALVARLGFVRIRTARSNIEGAHITRDYRWWTSVGARLSMVDDGLTLGTNHRAGVCIHFRDKVQSRLRPGGHSALTVTVADLDGLVAALGPASPRTA
ncbi:MAG TPA: hypothetical protein VG435_07675 [Acidimicrobiales bacterium]|jgi:hypothetical protein|nr:hypothetical protein [Acidimicrobiales bacterium]